MSLVIMLSLIHHFAICQNWLLLLVSSPLYGFVSVSLNLEILLIILYVLPILHNLPTAYSLLLRRVLGQDLPSAATLIRLIIFDPFGIKGVLYLPINLL